MSEREPETPLSGCLLRVFWPMIGPLILIVTTVLLVLHQPRIGSPLDIVLVAVAAACIGARLLDRPKSDLAGESSGDVSQSNPKVYVMGVVLSVIVAFVLAHFLVPRIS